MKNNEVFSFRQWRLYDTYEKLLEQFGYDVMNFHTQLFQLAIFYLTAFSISSGLAGMYYLTDSKPDVTFMQNISTFLSDQPYSSFRGIVWSFVLFVAVCFVRSSSYQRKYYQFELNREQKVEDYSLVIMDVPPNIAATELRSHLAYYIGGEKKIHKMFYIKKPRLLQRENQLKSVEQEYYQMMKENGDLTIKGCFFTCCSSIHIIQLFQALGFYRDGEYYRKRISKLQKAFKQATVKEIDAMDAVVVTLTEIELVKKLQRKLSSWFGGKLKNAYRLRAVAAPAPDDILYENLEYQGIGGFLRSVAAYFIVLVTAAGLFLVVSLVRNYQFVKEFTAHTFVEEKLWYYSIFLFTLVFDLALRPVLFAATNFEKHRSYSAKERSWMYKFYMYCTINKMTLFYSRTIMLMFQLGSDSQLGFFNIFGYTNYWRDKTGGNDAVSYMFTVVVGYNILEILEYAFYFVFYRMIAKTQHDKIKAQKSEPQRYSSKYVDLEMVFTFVLCFGHVQPMIMLWVVLYFPIHSLVNRFILLRLSSPPPKTQSLSRSHETIQYFGIIFAGICVAQSYNVVDKTKIWLVLPAALTAFILLINMGIFDFIVKKVDRKIAPALETDNFGINFLKRINGDISLKDCAEYNLVGNQSKLTDGQIREMEKRSQGVKHEHSDSGEAGPLIYTEK